jgi:hypothetical protein
MDVDRVYGLTTPNAQDQRLYTTRWSLLMAAKKLGWWSVGVNVLPWTPATEEPGTCTATLPVTKEGAGPLTVQCTDDTLTAIAQDAASEWSVSQIKPARRTGALQTHIHFETSEEDPTVMRGVVAPRPMRLRLAGQPQPANVEPDSSGAPQSDRTQVVAVRKIPPNIPDQAWRTLPTPIHLLIRFELNEKRRPTQITLTEANSMLWNSLLDAGFAWRFRVPRDAEQLSYPVTLTLKR